MLLRSVHTLRFVKAARRKQQALVAAISFGDFPEKAYLEHQ